MDIQKTPSWRSEDIRVVGLGGDPKIPAHTSDGAQSGLTGQLDGRVELGTDGVDVLLAAFQHCSRAVVATVVPRVLARVGIGQRLLRHLQVRPEDVDVVQQRGRPHRPAGHPPGVAQRGLAAAGDAARRPARRVVGRP